MGQHQKFHHENRKLTLVPKTGLACGWLTLWRVDGGDICRFYMHCLSPAFCKTSSSMNLKEKWLEKHQNNKTKQTKGQKIGQEAKTVLEILAS